jgi:hypothetical protein
LEHVHNFGLRAWVDAEWPVTLQNAPKKLWNMYHCSNSARIDRKIQHARFVEELDEEKTKIENKYGSRLVDVKKFAEETEKSVLKNNYKRIMSGADDEVVDLKKEVAEMKKLHKYQAKVMRANKEE